MSDKNDKVHLKNVGIFHTDENSIEDDEGLIDYGTLEEVTDDIATRLQRNEEVIRMFRDLERAILILKSSILNPKDISRKGVGYNIKGLYLPNQIVDAFTNIIKTEMEETYNFISTLGDIVLESYIMNGAYCTVFMNYEETKHTIYNDNIVTEQNVPVKSMDKHLEMDSLTPKERTPEFIIENDLSKYMSHTTDINAINDAEAFVEGFSENDENGELTEEEKQFNKEIEDVFSILKYSEKERERIKMYETPLKKRGTIFKVNVDSIIPIPLKSNPKKHLEYYILLDEDGMPVDKVRELEESTDRADLSQKYIDAMGDGETMEVKSIFDKIPPNVRIDDKTFDNIIGNLVVTDRLKHKTLDSTLNDIHTIMLFRALKKQYTKVLILPARAVSYIAINYRSNGTGESLMERVQILASMRGMVAISDVMGYIDNNIPKTKIKAKIPASNKKPMQVAASIIANTVKNRQIRMPVNMLKMTDFVNWGHTVGIAYEFDHPRMVNLQMSAEEGPKSNFGGNDNDMEKKLRDKMLLTLGVPPEFVDNSVSPNFATEILAQNALYNLTINGIQEDLNRHLSEYVRKHAIYDGIIFDKLMDIVNDNKQELNSTLSIELDENSSEKLVKYILNFFTISLPAVEVTMDEGLDKKFKDYTETIDTYVDKIYDKIEDDRIEDMDLVMTAIKHKLYSKWLLDNDYMTELIQVFNIVDNENKKNVLVDYKYVIDNIVDGFKDYHETLKENGDEDETPPDNDEDEDNDGDETTPDEDGGDETIPDDNEDNDETTPDDNEDEGDDNVGDNGDDNEDNDKDNDDGEDGGEDNKDNTDDEIEEDYKL